MAVLHQVTENVRRVSKDGFDVDCRQMSCERRGRAESSRIGQDGVSGTKAKPLSEALVRII